MRSKESINTSPEERARVEFVRQVTKVNEEHPYSQNFKQPKYKNKSEVSTIKGVAKVEESSTSIYLVRLRNNELMVCKESELGNIN